MSDAPQDRIVATVRQRVIASVAATAAAGVPGVDRVARGDSVLVRWLAGPAVRTTPHDGLIDVEMRLIARAGTALPELAERVRRAVASAVERQLGLHLGQVTVIVDGVRG